MTIEMSSEFNPTDTIVVDQSEILMVSQVAMKRVDGGFVAICFEGYTNFVEGAQEEESVGFVGFTDEGFRQYVENLNKFVETMD